MTIRINQDQYRIEIEVTSDTDIAEFKQLIRRGIGTWADASPSIKTASDLILHGKQLQDYELLTGKLSN